AQAGEQAIENARLAPGREPERAVVAVAVHLSVLIDRDPAAGHDLAAQLSERRIFEARVVEQVWSRARAGRRGVDAGRGLDRTGAPLREVCLVEAGQVEPRAVG